MHYTKLLLFLFFLYALQSCVTDYFDSPYDIEVDDITSFRQFFEKNAPALVPVSFDGSDGDIFATSSRRSLPTRVSTFNIVPDWASYRRVEYEKYTLLEIPLGGEIYNRATLTTQHQSPQSSGGFVMETRVFSSRSFMLVRDDGKGGVPRSLVVTLTVDNDWGGEIRFLENLNFSGVVVISTIQGHYLKSYHIKNGKRHPIRITPNRRSDEGKGFTQFTLEYSSGRKTRGYSTRESGGNNNDYGFGTGGSYTYCALCGTGYDMDKDDCECNVDILGEWPYTYCAFCYTGYNPLKGDCPNGCGVDIWGHYDPWDDLWDDGGSGGGDYGGGGSWGGSSGGTTTPVAPKAKKIFRNSNMTDANWKTIENMLDKIIQDCMGEGLYNGLKTYLN